MFQRILYEDWQLVIPVVALAAVAGFFGLVIWRALRMKRGQLERLARMPLDDDSPASARHE
jgi:cbb3-type cytochrome oxidase subunit 3